MDKKTSEAQLRANKKWNEAHKEKTKISRLKWAAKAFIRDYATEEDMKELNEIFENKNKPLD